jgi:hypothetical protein
MKRHNEYKKKGIVPEYNVDITNALRFLKRVKVKIPFADKLEHTNFPTKNIIMRTHYPRFLDFICASAAFHQFQREYEEQGFLLATGEDYDIARECFLKLCSNRYMIPLTINQKKILEIFEEEPLIEKSVTEFFNEKMNFISDRAISYNFGTLVKYGILETISAINHQNKEITRYRLAGSYIPDQQINIPTYEELLNIASEPSSPSLTSTSSPSSKPKEFYNESRKKVNEVAKVAKVKKQDKGGQDLTELRKFKKIIEEIE